MSLKTRRLLEFENYRLDTSEQVLTHGGIKVPLTPKVFDTLCVLVENAGSVVNKDDLMQLIWKDRFVEESNLTFNIKMLRKALGDNAARPRFIETVPRRGYRFIAETKQVQIETGMDMLGPDGPATGTDPDPQRTSFLSRHRIPTVLVAVFSIIIFAAASWYLTGRTKDAKSMAPIFSTPRRSESLSYSGSLYHTRISPDGKYIAYFTKDSENRNIWLRELSTGTHFPLLSSSTDDYIGLMFSAESDFVYFARKPIKGSQAQAGIYRISIFGGIPTRIVSDVQGWFSLSPINDQIAFVRFDADNRSELWVADADGERARKISVRNAPFDFRANRWSPDGKTLAVAVGQADSGANDFGLLEISVDSREEHEITPKKFLNIDDIEWLPERSGLLVAARENSSPNGLIWRVSLESGEAIKVIDDGASYVNLSLDRAATQMAVSQTIPDFRLYISTFADPARSISTASAASVATFTSGGKVVYANVKGQVDIWMMNSDGTGQRQLTNSPLEDIFPLVSRDDKYLFFVSGQAEGRQIWRMKADGSDQIPMTRHGGGVPIFISPDGSTLFYMSVVTRELWKVPFDGGEENLFFAGPVICPAFSPDGKYLAFFQRDPKSDNSYDIKVVSTADLTEYISFKPADETAAPVQIAWAHDGRFFYYASTMQSVTTLWRQPISDAAREKVAEIGAGQTVLDLAVAPDGRTFSYVAGTWKRETKLVKGLL